MSGGFTGLILRVWAERRYRRSVQIVYSESYEYPDVMTCYGRNGKLIKFDSVFRAELFCRRANEGQFKRYKGVKLI